MDEKNLELAADLTESLVTTGIEKARLKRIKPAGFDGFCDCGEEVPAARIALEYYNCVHCQSLKEGRGRFYAR